MVQRVPVLEFLHELYAAGLHPDAREALDDPQAWWDRLPPARRELFLARRSLAPAQDAPVRLRALRLRGRPAVPENLFVEVEVGPPGGLAARLGLALRSLRFGPLAGGDATPPDAEAIPLPESVFREAALADAARPTLRVLDAVWGEPYDAAREGALVSYEPIPGFEESERAWVDEGLALSLVLRREDGERVFHVEEPRLSEMEKALLVTLNERLRDVLVDAPVLRGDRHAHLARKVLELLRVYRFRVDRATAYKLGYYFLRNYLGFGRLEPVMRDQAIEDISCNGPGLPLFVAHGRHQNLRTTITFDEVELNSFVIKLAQRGGKLLSLAQPMVDATLPGGSRLQACLGREVTARGSSFTVRKFREDPLTCVDLIRGGTHTLDTMAYLWLAVEMRASILVMGATASGKTTTLNCLSQFIPPTLKIVTIEDTREIMLQQENWLAAVTRDTATGAESEKITMFDLLRAALRQRPDHLIVGEIRGAEGLTLFQAMSTGHTCYSTMHAGSVQNAVYRLENPPIGVPRVMLTSLDFLLLQGQADLQGRHVRRMLSLTEVDGLDAQTRTLRTNEVFRWDGVRDAFEQLNAGQALDSLRGRRGWTRTRLAEELAGRRRVLEGLVARNERHYSQVAKAVHAYYARGGEARPRALTPAEGAA